MVGRVRDIDHDRCVRLETVAARARAAAGAGTDLLLRGPHGDDPRPRALLPRPTQRLQGDEGPDPVVDGPGSHSPIAQLQGV